MLWMLTTLNIGTLNALLSTGPFRTSCRCVK